MILLSILSLTANSKSLNDSTKSKFIDRIVSAISNKCDLNDSTKNELSSYFYCFYVELRKLRSNPKCEIECFGEIQKREEIFLTGLKKKFGNNVYQYYKLFCLLPIRKPNRITKSTSE